MLERSSGRLRRMRWLLQGLRQQAFITTRGEAGGDRLGAVRYGTGGQSSRSTVNSTASAQSGHWMGLSFTEPPRRAA